MNDHSSSSTAVQPKSTTLLLLLQVSAVSGLGFGNAKDDAGAISMILQPPKSLKLRASAPQGCSPPNPNRPGEGEGALILPIQERV